MNGCFDFTCAHCGGRVSWTGTLEDNPPCPRCGEYLRADVIDQARVMLEQVAAEEAEARKAHAKKPVEILPGKTYSFPIEGRQAEELRDKFEMPSVEYPGPDDADYQESADHNDLELEEE